MPWKKQKNSPKKPSIILLIDGFDEISPSYSKQTTTLLVSLQATNVHQIWITTRSHQKLHLEHELDSPIYYIQPLKTTEQKEFLQIFFRWHLNSISVGKIVRARKYVEIRRCLENVQKTSGTLNDTTFSESIKDILEKFPKRITKKSSGKLNELKNALKLLSFDKYIDKILSDWNNGVFDNDRDFHGTPLNLKMLVEVICAQRSSAEDEVISKFERFYLYNKFVDMKFRIFFGDTSKAKLTIQASRHKWLHFKTYP